MNALESPVPGPFAGSRESSCSGRLEECGATTQAEWVAGRCAKCDPDELLDGAREVRDWLEIIGAAKPETVSYRRVEQVTRRLRVALEKRDRMPPPRAIIYDVPVKRERVPTWVVQIAIVLFVIMAYLFPAVFFYVAIAVAIIIGVVISWKGGKDAGADTDRARDGG